MSTLLSLPNENVEAYVKLKNVKSFEKVYFQHEKSNSLKCAQKQYEDLSREMYLMYINVFSNISFNAPKGVISEVLFTH